jgi:exodeoxyribonuclease V beta subunit
MAAAAEGTIRIEAADETPGKWLQNNAERNMPLRFRKFNGTIASDWKISSFSSLTATRSPVMAGSLTLQDKALDRDAIPDVQPLPAEREDITPDIFAFPRGVRPGTLLHELLEQADFSNQYPVAEKLICEKLQYFGYETSWHPIIAEMLANLGNVLLHNDIPGLRLSNIPHANCLHELEFYFPLSRVTPDVLRSIFCTQGLHGSVFASAALLDRQLDRLIFAPARGFMRGFIDLVFEFEGRFFIVDWKSNFLGSTIENYCQDKLADSILSGFYFLQYHIYCLALHLYLQKRVPGYLYESHFGGVFYVYVRGVKQNLGPGYGIFHDLPDLATIELLAAKFIANGKT